MLNIPLPENALQEEFKAEPSRGPRGPAGPVSASGVLHEAWRAQRLGDLGQPWKRRLTSHKVVMQGVVKRRTCGLRPCSSLEKFVGCSKPTAPLLKHDVCRFPGACSLGEKMALSSARRVLF